MLLINICIICLLSSIQDDSHLEYNWRNHYEQKMKITFSLGLSPFPSDDVLTVMSVCIVAVA
jgi:hypothetical protein